MNEPDYYVKNGLSPVGAFKQGLMSTEQYIGFVKGNIIKYAIRAGDTDDASKDVEKGIYYFKLLGEVLTPPIDNPTVQSSNSDFGVELDLDELKKQMEEILK